MDDQKKYGRNTEMEEENWMDDWKAGWMEECKNMVLILCET
jgi:hypothetical protein